MTIYSAIPASQSKLCNKCKELKLIQYFSKKHDTKDGYASQCKSCAKQYQQDNKDALKTSRETNKGALRAYDKEYRQTNKDKVNAKEAKRRASKLSATPKWYERDLVNQLYTDCRIISESTGILHHVDHIVPLQSDIVQGLHCFANLRIITASENLSKSNSYWPDMP